jgi:hypothetical protein
MLAYNIVIHSIAYTREKNIATIVQCNYLKHVIDFALFFPSHHHHHRFKSTIIPM